MYPKAPGKMVDDIIENVKREINNQNKSEALKKAREYTSEQLEYIKNRAIKSQIKQNEIRMNLLEKFKQGKRGNEVFEEMMPGSVKTGEGSKTSFEATNRALMNEHLRAYDGIIGKDAEILSDAVTQRSLFNIMDKLNKGLEIQGPYKAVAEKIKAVNKYIVNNMKRAGMEIKDRADYIIRQTHDAAKLVKEGFDVWEATIRENLDIAKTFGKATDAEIKAALLEDYNNIIGKDFGTSSAGTVGHKRAYHFKDGDSFFNYHSQFGEGNMMDVLNKSVRNLARNEAMERTFGPGRLQAVEAAETYWAELLKSKGTIDEYKTFMDEGLNGDKFYREKWKKETFGYGGIHKDVIVSNGLSIVRTGQAVFKLAGSMFSTFTDISTAMPNMMAKTVGLGLAPIKKTFIGWSRNLTPKQQAQMGKIVGISTALDNGRYVDEDGLRGGIKKFTKFALSANLLEYLTKINRQAMATAFSSFLADSSELIFKKLPTRLKAELSSFKISETDWDVIRKAVSNEIEDLPLISADLIPDIEVRIKYQSFLLHNAKMGAIAPGMHTKAMMRMGISPDSIQGQAIATVLQFKSFGVEAGRAIREIMHSNPDADNSTFFRAMGNVDNIKIMSAMGVLGLGAGVAQLWANDLAKGRTPRDMDAEAWMEAMGRMVLPLWGSYIMDYAQGDVTEYGGKNVASLLLGPTGSDLFDIAKLGYGVGHNIFSDEKPKKIAKPAIDFAKRHTPFNNTPIVGMILEHGFYKELYEAFGVDNQRNVRKTMRKRGQEYILPLE